MDRLESPSTADAAPESFNIYTMDTLYAPSSSFLIL